MPLSLRMPSEKEKILKRAASKEGKTKTAYILEAVYDLFSLEEKGG